MPNVNWVTLFSQKKILRNTGLYNHVKKMDGMDGWMDVWIDRQPYRQTVRWMDGQMFGLTDSDTDQTAGWMNGFIENEFFSALPCLTFME